MFRKLTILVTLLAFSPAAVGAQEVALLMNSPAPAEQSAEQAKPRELRLIPSARTMVAANDLQATDKCAEVERARKTHTGLTFKEFVEVHFGEYRWLYWVGAAAALVALHIAVAD